MSPGRSRKNRTPVGIVEKRLAAISNFVHIVEGEYKAGSGCKGSTFCRWLLASGYWSATSNKQPATRSLMSEALNLIKYLSVYRQTRIGTEC